MDSKTDILMRIFSLRVLGVATVSCRVPSCQVETILFRVHDKVLTDPGAVTADNVLKVR